jgi:hypothetical protein
MSSIDTAVAQSGRVRSGRSPTPVRQNSRAAWSAMSAGHALLRRLADADEDPAGEGDAQLAGRPDRLEPPRRVLRRRALVDHEVRVDRFQHQPLRGGHLAEPQQVRAGDDAEVRMRQQPAFERALACPHHIGGEVVVAPLAQPSRDLGVDLRALAREHEQLLDVPLRGAVEHRDHLVGLVQMRLVRGEGAVLAVAAAGPRQRQRQVAREGDATTHPSEV